MLMMRPRGRIPSLLAWGLLVGGVALLITFPDGVPPERMTPGQLPAAFLFALAGVVFGLTHPEGKAWAGALLLGWVPLLAAALVAIRGAAVPDVGVWLALMLLPAILAATGSWAGARFARSRRHRG